jgi:hypothetical protein
MAAARIFCFNALLVKSKANVSIAPDAGLACTGHNPRPKLNNTKRNL